MGYFVSVVYQRYRQIKSGRPVNRSDQPRKRWKYFCTQVLWQKKIRDFPIFWVSHLFIVWGFIVLLYSSLDMVLNGLFQVQIPYVNNAGYLLIRDTAIILVIAGVFGCLLRRIIKKPKWVKNNMMAFVILLLIMVIVVSELLFYTIQATQEGSSSLTGAAWLVLVTSKLLKALNLNTGYNALEISWWTHFLAMFSFLLIIPRSKHFHLVLAPFNTYWHSLEHKGALLPVPLDEEKGQTYGVNKLEEFTWKQLLDAYSCVKCGRCNNSCPAQLSGEPTKPKKVNGTVRKHLEDKNKKKKTVSHIFEKEFIWGCTTCGGCVEACPVSCEHTSKFIDMRRYIVSSDQNVPPEIKQVFKGIENYGTPWDLARNQSVGYTQIKALRLPTLTENPQAEYLYFLGCTTYYDESALKTAVAFAKILKSTGVNFAILGEDEWCCGETVRRMGNEQLFQKTVKKNIDLWRNLGIKKILTTCPHCFNTLQNEYSQFGGHYEVIPHAAFLADLLNQGKLNPVNSQAITVTYHDPCYLGRYNGFYNQPREILKSLPGASLIEMPRTKESSFCCGAGGGRFWQKAETENAISINRTQEALATGAKVICTTCPYCLLTLNEEIRRRDPQQEIIAMDIAELLEASL